MSHSVTITRTTTSTSGSALILNTGYLKTVPGLLKLAQLLLGIAAVTLIALQFRAYYNYKNDNSQLFFFLMAVTFMIGTFCLLLSCLVSLSTGGIISKTIYELIYHSIAFILYLVASIFLLIDVNKHNYPEQSHNKLFIAGIIGCVLSLLYLISAVLAQRSYRGL